MEPSIRLPLPGEADTAGAGGEQSRPPRDTGLAGTKETFLSPPLPGMLKEIKRKQPSITGIERGAKPVLAGDVCNNKVSRHPSAAHTAGNETPTPVPALATIN